MGNIGSVCNALKFLGGCYLVTNNIEDLKKADAYILPGVGAFKAAMNNLNHLDLTGVLTDQVMDKKKPYLGICLGMQLLAMDSTEQGFSKGLGWINGHVVSMQPSGSLRVPHVGWNNVSFEKRAFVYNRIDDGAHFFFDHTFHVVCEKDIVIGTCDYGGRVVSAVQSENIVATQFHPEKSQRNGLKLLRNYLNFVNEH